MNMHILSSEIKTKYNQSYLDIRVRINNIPMLMEQKDKLYVTEDYIHILKKQTTTFQLQDSSLQIPMTQGTNMITLNFPESYICLTTKGQEIK